MVETGQHLEIFKGQDEVFPFVIDTDVTGWNLVFRVRNRDNSSTVLWELTHSGMTLSAGTQSTISVPIGTANSGTINEGVYEYVLQRTNAGSVRPLALGEFKVRPSAYTT